MKIKTFIGLSVAISLAIGLIWIGVGYFFMKTAFDNFPTRSKNNDYNSYLIKPQFDVKRYEKLKKKEITLISKIDGIQLKGTLIFPQKHSSKTIIFSHGITDSRWFILRNGRIDSLLNRGFNILTFDQRAHGASEGDVPTYGYLEKYDLDQWVDTVANTFKSGTIGVEGVSMGAATAILHAGEINPKKDSLHKVAFYIFDCPYSNLEEQLAHRLNRDYHLPNMALTTSLNIVNRPLKGFDIKDISPINAAPKIDVPVMFIHGMADDYVPTYMSTDMYNMVKSTKMLVLVPQRKHAEAIRSAKIYWMYHDIFTKKMVHMR